VRTIGVFVLVIPSLLFGQQSPKTQQTSSMSSSDGNAPAVRASATAVDGLPTARSFDIIQGRFNPVQVNVEVRESARRLNPAAPRSFEISGEEVISAAGSYGDFR